MSNDPRISIEDAVHLPVRRCVRENDPDAEWEQLRERRRKWEVRQRLSSRVGRPLSSERPSRRRAQTHCGSTSLPRVLSGCGCDWPRRHSRLWAGFLSGIPRRAVARNRAGFSLASSRPRSRRRARVVADGMTHVRLLRASLGVLPTSPGTRPDPRTGSRPAS